MGTFRRGIKRILEFASGHKIDGVHGGYVISRYSVDNVDLSDGLYGRLLSIELASLLSRYAVNLVLDVGANTGQFAEFLRSEIHYEGRIISFEPISTSFEKLKEASAGDPNWDAHNMAIGSRNAEEQMNVAGLSGFSSFLKSNAYSHARFGEPSLGTKTEAVVVRRIDGILAEIVRDVDETRIFLKMDTQGYDLEVFAGVGDKMKHIVALLSEVSVVPIYENMPHLTESIALFEQAGFEIAGLFPVTRDKPSLRVIEYDCMMVRAAASR